MSRLLLGFGFNCSNSNRSITAGYFRLDFFKLSDIVINYALVEVLPTGILEAMSIGKPIVSITEGFTCSSDVIINEYNGIRCENDEKLTNSLLKLIKNKDERIRMG